MGVICRPELGDTMRHDAGLIVFAAAHHFRVRPEAVLGYCRSNRIAEARHVSAYLMRKLLNMSTPAVGELLNRDHSTVINSTRRVNTVDLLRRHADRVEAKLREAAVARAEEQRKFAASIRL